MKYLLMISLLISLSGCMDYWQMEADSAKAVISFKTDIKPIVLRRCMPCHTGHIQTLPNFTIYETALDKIETIKNRVWIQKNMPPGGGTITKSERKLINEWMGAK